MKMGEIVKIRGLEQRAIDPHKNSIQSEWPREKEREWEKEPGRESGREGERAREKSDTQLLYRCRAQSAKHEITQ